MVGDKGAGKSTIVLTYDDDYYGYSFLNTLGIHFTIKPIYIDNFTIKLQIWDMTENSNSGIPSTKYRGASGIMIVCDI